MKDKYVGIIISTTNGYEWVMSRLSHMWGVLGEPVHTTKMTDGIIEIKTRVKNEMVKHIELEFKLIELAGCKMEIRVI